MPDLTGKVAVVAGSATGVGAATAKRLARDGAKVVLGDINADGARMGAEQITGEGGSATWFGFDISDEAAVESLMQHAMDAYGQINLLHNCAADFSDSMLFNDTDAVRTPLDVYDRALAVNLRGYLLTCRSAIPHMLEAGGGAIVNTSSLASQVAERGLRMAYGISKSGVNALSRHVAVTYGKQGVRCNVVSLGMVLTEKLRVGLPAEVIEQYTAQIPSPRACTPEDVAAAVAFLLSDDAEAINGQTIIIDRGQSVATGA
ncbi:MAG: SDR family oxidoreductase [Acidimicrobiales bacterium]|jgi:NAD(P)-dependent dehydrogenase (short-subunit alcohol dehydrogenase family)